MRGLRFEFLGLLRSLDKPQAGVRLTTKNSWAYHGRQGKGKAMYKQFGRKLATLAAVISLRGSETDVMSEKLDHWTKVDERS